MPEKFSGLSRNGPQDSSQDFETGLERGLQLGLSEFFVSQNINKQIINLEATPGSIKKATKYGMKIFQGKNLKTLF